MQNATLLFRNFLSFWVFVLFWLFFIRLHEKYTYAYIQWADWLTRQMRKVQQKVLALTLSAVFRTTFLHSFWSKKYVRSIRSSVWSFVSILFASLNNISIIYFYRRLILKCTHLWFCLVFSSWSIKIMKTLETFEDKLLKHWFF